MSKEQFASLNAAQREVGEREYSNPRNLVAGVLNRCFLFLRPCLCTVSHSFATWWLARHCHQTVTRKQDTDLGLRKKPFNLICYTLMSLSDGSARHRFSLFRRFRYSGPRPFVCSFSFSFVFVFVLGRR